MAAFTVQIPGFGFLRDDFPEPYLAKWDIDRGWAASKDLPGIRLPGAPFMGTIGLAPPRELVDVPNLVVSAFVPLDVFV